VTVETFKIDGLPGFTEDSAKDPPAKGVRLKRRVREADAILFVTPESNYSVPRVLKNAIDSTPQQYGYSAWAGKPAAIMGHQSAPSGRPGRSATIGRSLRSWTCSR
jgi:chromate reductase